MIKYTSGNSYTQKGGMITNMTNGKEINNENNKGNKTVVYDKDLNVEACRFEGIAQPFPNHFHEHYVIGFIENGERSLSCRNREYTIQTGDIILFNPGDNHSCCQLSGGTLDYCSLNISKNIMLRLALEITGVNELPGFSRNVIRDEEASCYIQTLHELMMTGSMEFEKEETLFLLISLIIQRYGQSFEGCIPECPDEIEKACAFMERNYSSHISLKQICHQVGLSHSTLLRAFTRTKGVTPYSYLVNIRVSRAKELLESGVSPTNVALQTGFSDQSHFTTYFSRFIGVTPGNYREIYTRENNREDCIHDKK